MFKKKTRKVYVVTIVSIGKESCSQAVVGVYSSLENARSAVLLEAGSVKPKLITKFDNGVKTVKTIFVTESKHDYSWDDDEHYRIEAFDLN